MLRGVVGELRVRSRHHAHARGPAGRRHLLPGPRQARHCGAGPVGRGGRRPARRRGGRGLTRGRDTETQKSPLHITLHAGELAAKYLPANHLNALTFHIRQAVEKGHAERIGHGIAIQTETDSAGLLALMAQRQVMVEVCLSSNVQILEVSGASHPLATYMANNVPVALNTDDQGVSRSSLAGEYRRGALDQKLSYRQLKRMARTSLDHAFLPGATLWASLDTVAPVEACAPTATMGVGDPPSPACQAFLDGSERARMQWELERRFRAFESQQ
ncbi:MAG: hypothetical protein EOO75_12545 [Myxococcales bacterium]|nr:MAG: hypothetical protein EOO75_12545 [Myxococcales bacterium]